MTQSAIIAWIDVETSGLNPRSDTLLEVACLITDQNLNLLDETGYEAVVLSDAEHIRKNTDPYVIDMHQKTGLWNKLSQGIPVSQIDADLTAYIRKYAGEEKPYLGGNSITLDRNFIEIHLPHTFQTLHYRSIDMTTISLALNWWGVAKREYVEPAHTAMEDIRQSLAEARRYMNLLRT